MNKRPKPARRLDYIGFKVTRAEKLRFMAASVEEGVSVSEFVRDAATARVDRTLFPVSEHAGSPPA